MKKLSTIIILILVLIGCVTIQPSSKSEKDNAMRAYQQCALRYAKEYDDGVSDAKTIAEITADYCENEYKVSLETYTRGMSARGQKLFYKQAMTKDERIQTPLTAVLKVRSKDK